MNPRTLITAPAREPLMIQEAKDHLRVDSTDHDAAIDAHLMQAREYTEQYLRRALITQTWDVKRHVFSDRMLMPLPPLQSVTSIKYIDTAGVEQTLSTDIYDVDTASDPGVIRLAYGQSWPSVRDVDLAVTIRIVCGYGDDPADVPINIRYGMLLHIERMFDRDDRTAVSLDLAAQCLLFPYRNLEI